MAFEHGTLVKTIAMVAQATQPYLSEGAVKLDQAELVGKRVGDEFKFSYDSADYGEVSENGMQTSFPNSGAGSSKTESIKIWDAAAKLSNGALDKKLAMGDWEQFAKQTGMELGNRMTTKVFVRDMGKASDVVICSDVNALTAKLLGMNEFGATVRGYGSYNAVGKMMSTSKLNAPVIANDSYADGQAWQWGNLATLRCVKAPSIKLGGAAASEKKISITTAKAVTVSSGSVTAGDAVKLDGKNIVVYFPTTAESDAIVIGKVDSTITNNTIDSSTDTYEPIMVRADGAQGLVDAASLVEAADKTDSYEGVGIAHTEIPNANRGKDHYWDCVCAAGVARAEAVKCYLLKA